MVNNQQPALDETRRSVRITASSSWWRRLFAFVGPAYMVAVGYMDPGNWATDLAGGARFGYTLLWVLLMSNAMAVLLQTLSARLGLVTGHDLAQACRAEYIKPVRYVLFVLCEIAIAATDLAEVLGTAIGLNLLFRIPILWAVVVTGFDTLLLLVIQRLGIRKMEAFIVCLVTVIGVCFIIEVFLSKPDPALVAVGFIPGPFRGQPLTAAQLYVAIGILGATVMPHNLYMHSALVQSRDVARSAPGVKEACRYNLIDSIVAMNGAFLINAAILIVAAAVFFTRGQVVQDLREAPALLENLLGSRVAPVAFAVALLASGQSSTVTGTLAGQITMEGFLNFRMRAWLRRLLTRMLAIAPAVAVIAAAGEGSVTSLLVFSQVLLSLQLPFAVVPLVKFTSSRRKMGPFASPAWVQVLAWTATAIIVGLNAAMLWGTIGEWVKLAGAAGWLVATGLLSVAAALLGLLAWMALRREAAISPRPVTSAQQVAQAAGALQRQYRRIGVALEAMSSDAKMLAEAIALARTHQAELVLMHVVEGVGGQWYGPQTGDLESRHDEQYLLALAEQIAHQPQPPPAVRAALGYGSMPRALVELARKEQVDLLVVGGHGHRVLGDLVHGDTIHSVHHQVNIPLLAVR